jgi:hypothetical protein
VGKEIAALHTGKLTDEDVCIDNDTHQAD